MRIFSTAVLINSFLVYVVCILYSPFHRGIFLLVVGILSGGVPDWMPFVYVFAILLSFLGLFSLLRPSLCKILKSRVFFLLQLHVQVSLLFR